VDLFERLRSGEFGVELSFPEGSVPVDFTERGFRIAGPRREVPWWVHFGRGLTLDLSDAGWPTLERDVRRHTRHLFETSFRRREMTPARLKLGPRTRDAQWSPIVELERAPIDGGTSLYVLHRVFYEPGRETLMGHVLVPCGYGLLETSWVTTTSTTGYRESRYMAQWGRAYLEPVITFPPQSIFDAPDLDAHFPDHPLSMARDARRWLASEVKLSNREAARGSSQGPIDLPLAGYRLLPPPRFGAPATSIGPLGRNWTRLNRASFSVTDGVDWFSVVVEPRPLRIVWSGVDHVIEVEAQRLARAAFDETGVVGVHAELLDVSEVAGRLTATVLVEGESGLGGERMVALCTASEKHLVSLFLSTMVSLPVNELRAELLGAAQTLDRLPAA
jgi:hypothetical protein